jgi:hypothetical protein
VTETYQHFFMDAYCEGEEEEKGRPVSSKGLRGVILDE